MGINKKKHFYFQQKMKFTSAAVLALLFATSEAMRIENRPARHHRIMEDGDAPAKTDDGEKPAKGEGEDDGEGKKRKPRRKGGKGSDDEGSDSDGEKPERDGEKPERDGEKPERDGKPPKEEEEPARKGKKEEELAR